jgi:hypothetical protein
VKKPGQLDANDHCFLERAPARRPTRMPNSRPVVDPQGRVFESVRAAARAYRLSAWGVKQRIAVGVTGWRWAEPLALAPLLVRAAGLAYRDGRLDEAIWLLEHARGMS